MSDIETDPLLKPSASAEALNHGSTCSSRSSSKTKDKRSSSTSSSSSSITNDDEDDLIELDADVQLPKRKWILEPVVLLFCLGLMSTNAVLPQYVYYRVSLLHNATANVTRAFVCNVTASLNSSESALTAQIQNAASSWSLYRSVCYSGAALLVIPLFASSSDFLGRKVTIILPSIGALLDSVFCLLVLVLQLPLELLLISGALSGFCGGFGTFLAGVFAYLADTTSKSSRAVRIAIVESVFGVGMLVMEMAMGWWMRLSGYFAPLLFSCSALLLNLLYVAFILPEVRRRARQRPAGDGKLGTIATVLLPIRNIVQIFTISSTITASLLLLLLSLLLYSIGLMGAMAVGSVYQMNLPFCLDSVGIGYLNSAKLVAAQFGVFFGLLFLKRWLPQHLLALLGLVSAAAGNTITGLATSRTALFSAGAAGLFAMLPIPVYRAHMSRLLPAARQGALFSCVAVLEVMGNLLGSAVLLSVYKATIAFMPGFVFLASAALVMIAFVLTVASYCVERVIKPNRADGQYDIDG